MHLELDWTAEITRGGVTVMQQDCQITVDCLIDCQSLVEWNVLGFRFEERFTAYEAVETGDGKTLQPVAKTAYVTIDNATDPALFHLLRADLYFGDAAKKFEARICDELLAEGHISAFQVAA